MRKITEKQPYEYTVLYCGNIKSECRTPIAAFNAIQRLVKRKSFEPENVLVQTYNPKSVTFGELSYDEFMKFYNDRENEIAEKLRNHLQKKRSVL